MIKVALTGNIGSGKSTVAKIFKLFKIPVFNADNEARSLYSEMEVKNNLRTLFSNKIFTNVGEVDTKALASIIFNDKKALEAVNLIIHPMVMDRFNSWCNKYSTSPYTIHETAILFENKLQSNFEYIINVSAPKSIRLKRVIERDRTSKKMVEARMANQLDDIIKCELSQFVINNDGSIFITPQIVLIHKALLSK